MVYHTRSRGGVTGWMSFQGVSRSLKTVVEGRQREGRGYVEHKLGNITSTSVKQLKSTAKY